MGQCQTKSVVYQATVLSEGSRNQTYVGLTAGTFKKRFDGHTFNFRNENSKGTTLSSYIWKLKREGKSYEILWREICKASPFSPVTEQCALCTDEKFHIYKPDLGSLNLRNELGAHCRHKQSVLLDKTYTKTKCPYNSNYLNLVIYVQLFLNSGLMSATVTIVV